MKKIVCTAAALGLLAGLATTASAVEFKISGSYTAEGIYMDKGAGHEVLTSADKAGVAADFNNDFFGGDPVVTTAMIPTYVGGVDLWSDDATSDAWYQHTFIVKPTMKVNDKVSMAAEIRFMDNNVWGSQDDTHADKGIGGSGEIYVRALHMDYDSPIGKVRIGRIATGGYGLDFADNDTRGDRIMWWPNFLAKPWSTLFYIQKNTEHDRYDGSSSSDSDHYEARLNFKNDSLDAGIRYGFTNNNSYTNPDWADNGGTADNHDNELQSVSIFGIYKMDNLFAKGELTHNFGDKTASVEYDNWGGMVQVGGKFGPATPSLMYFYASGDNDLTGDDKAFGSTGTEFTPLYILTGRNTGMLNPDQNALAHILMKQTGVHALVAAVDYAVSDRLTLHGAIGWAKADDEFPTQDDEYGWEYNIGAAYKLLDNLTYEARAGYLDTGDYFKFGDADINTENVFVLSHSLTMTF